MALLTLDEYQEAAHTTSLVSEGVDSLWPRVSDPEDGYAALMDYGSLAYATLKLNGEAGEVAELIGKALRDDGGVISMERSAKLEKEVGDVLWYVAELCTIMGWSFSELASKNLQKLAKRKGDGTLKGDGSDR